MQGQEPGALARSQGLVEGKGAKGGPGWAESPPLMVRQTWQWPE